MYIFLKLKEDTNIVIDAYLSEIAQDDNDVIHQEISENADINQILNILELVDENGQYNNKYENALIKMTQEEKNIANISNSNKKIQDYLELLNDTDYKIIKCYEYSLVNLPLPYNIVELHNERQLLRNKINELN